MQETETIRAEFPHTAGEMLSSPEKIEEYRSKLGYRTQAAMFCGKSRRIDTLKSLANSFRGVLKPLSGASCSV